MFCPDGYISLSELIHNTPGLWEYYINDLNNDLCDPDFDYEIIKGFLTNSSRADISESNILFSLSDVLYICSPNGQLLRISISRLLIDCQRWAAGLRFMKEMEQNGDLSARDVAELKVTHGLGDIPRDEIFRDFEKSLNGSQRNAATLIHFLDTHRGQREHVTIAPFYERRGYTISLRFLRACEASSDCDVSQFQFVLDILRPFEGWAMCVKTSFVDDVWLPELQTHLYDPNNVQASNKSGRPNHKFLSAMKSYKELYPGGHVSTGDTWKQVAQKIADVAGTDISIDVIRRAANRLNPD